tara:strand:+ start:27754 stop:28545 length:792 start_codon:yes stop_codon:yes gene_type:complete
MNDFNFAQAGRASAGTMDASVDAGLRSFMLGVYNKLALGIALAGILALIAGTVEPVRNIVLFSPLAFVIAFGPPALIIGSMFFMKNPSPVATGFIYWAVVTLIGLSFGYYMYMASESMSMSTLGGIKQSFNFATITKAFLITATSFAALSLWGYTTKRDLTALGTFAIMGLWALFAVSIVYMILPMTGLIEHSGGMEWMISGGFALLSAVLVAWETQQLKHGYYQFAGDQRGLAVMTNWGALNFFIMFVNMFRFVLMLLASRE